MNTFLDAIRVERSNQDDRWGEQNHDPFYWVSILVEEIGEVVKSVLDRHVAFTDSPEMQRMWKRQTQRELVQVAAVAIAFAEYLDRAVT